MRRNSCLVTLISVVLLAIVLLACGGAGSHHGVPALACEDQDDGNKRDRDDGKPCALPSPTSACHIVIQGVSIPAPCGSPAAVAD